jgi:hypothetical protein
MLRQDDYRTALILTECWRQGKAHGVQVSQMIAGCLANRERLGWGKWMDILKNIPKYSSTVDLPNRDLWPDLWEPNFIKLLHTIPSILDGSASDPSCGGIYWADLAVPVTNPWFQQKVLDSPIHSVCCNQNSFTCFR